MMIAVFVLTFLLGMVMGAIALAVVAINFSDEKKEERKNAKSKEG